MARIGLRSGAGAHLPYATAEGTRWLDRASEEMNKRQQSLSQAVGCAQKARSEAQLWNSALVAVKAGI